MPQGVVVLDNTVLTNFALVNRPELLFGLWGGACATTSAVIVEYQAGIVVRGLPEDLGGIYRSWN